MLNNNKFKSKPENFKLETNTIWSFPDRGSWATHNSQYRGNWSPYIPRNLILRYTYKNDIVLDQFVGSGTTLIETKLLNRRGIGVDINLNAIKTSKLNTEFECENPGKIRLYNADARRLNFIPDNYVDLICTHPPYANIIKYSKNINGDLSLLKIEDFYKEMCKVASESYRVLKNNKYCAVLMGDTRKQGSVVTMGFQVMNIFLNVGFKVKEIIIKEQHNCKFNNKWKAKSNRYNFLLIAHEYLFIFEKREGGAK